MCELIARPRRLRGQKGKIMNKTRRKRLAEAAELLEQARDILEEVKDEEQEAHDNLPESLQQSERGEEMESYIEAIAEAQDYADNAYTAISDIA